MVDALSDVDAVIDWFFETHKDPSLQSFFPQSPVVSAQ